MAQTVFISSSRDMAEWAALAIAQIKDFAGRHGLGELEPFDYRDLDPAHLDHISTWQDSVGAPSLLGAALTLILLGERLGTPLPPDFSFRHEILERLSKSGYDWVHVAGASCGPLQPDQVPLTGVLFEFFDAFLPRADGLNSAPLRVIFKGTWDDEDEPDFGNGEFRDQIDHAGGSVKQKHQQRVEYHQQFQWLRTFWSKLFGLQQHVTLFCVDWPEFAEQLEKILAATFLAGSNYAEIDRGRQLDARQIELPGPSPYDLDSAALYFGRGPQVMELVRRALQHDSPRFLVPVVGESGTGKSSLLRSGLLRQAFSPSRRRLGWRVASLSLTECGSHRSPLLFLTEALAKALPELGSPQNLAERLEGLDSLRAANRFLEILACVQPQRAPGLGVPKLLLVIDQLEIALDAIRLASPDANEWNGFLQVVAALGGASLDPGESDLLNSSATRLSENLPISVVLAIPADRMNSLSAILNPGDYVMWLPRLTDETALREIVISTFSTLGISLDPRARDVLCRQAVKLALGSQASVLPVLSVTLASLHDNWKQRRAAEEASRVPAPSATPLGLKLIAIPRGPRGFDIEMQDLDEHRQIEKAIGRLGYLAWSEADFYQSELREQILKLPISGPRQRVISGEISPLDFVLAWLLRHLVAISGHEGTLDRLIPLPDSSMPAFARPLADSLLRNRLLTRYEDGSWWLVHQAVLSSWDRAVEWCKAEIETFRTMERIAHDYTRWKEETEAVDAHASHWLWTSPRYVEAAVIWMTIRGADDYPELTRFVRQSFIAAASQDALLAGRCLHTSVWFNDLDWSRAILEVGGINRLQACNRVNRAGSESVLTSSCHSRNPELVRFLLKNGADPNLEVANGWTPLLVAASLGADNICEVLLTAGAFSEHANSEGWTPLMFAAQHGLVDIVERIIGAGVDINRANGYGTSALHTAAANGHATIVKRLLESGAAPTNPDADGFTPLMLAAEHGHDAVVAGLLESGAPVEPESNDGSTALSVAAENGHALVVEHLVAAGAAVDSVTRVSQTNLAFYAIIEDDDAVESATALLLAAARGNDSVVAKLLAAGAAVNYKTKRGITALALSVYGEFADVAARLLAAGAEVETAADDVQTPLMLAVKTGSEHLVQLCLRYGADPMRRGKEGLSSLDLAYLYDYRPVIDLFLRIGAQPLSEIELKSVLRHKPKMNCGLVVNARGKMCLVHDQKLEGTPHSVVYHLDRRQIEIVFDNGATYLFDWEANDEMDSYLHKISKILIIRMENKKPIEGYDTSLLHAKEGTVVELD